MKKKGVISKIVFACIVIAFIILCLIQSPITSPVNSLWSLLPPVVAIGLALITKEVYSSLFLGIVTGGVLCMLSSAPVSVGEGETLGHGFTALFNAVVNEGIIKNLSDSWNVGILVFLVVLGIIVVLMNKAGGSRAYGEWAVRRIRTRKGASLATFYASRYRYSQGFPRQAGISYRRYRGARLYYSADFLVGGGGQRYGRGSKRYFAFYSDNSV